MVAEESTDSERTPVTRSSANLEMPTVEAPAATPLSGRQKVPAAVLLAGTNKKFGTGGARMSRARSGNLRNSLVPDKLKAERRGTVMPSK